MSQANAAWPVKVQDALGRVDRPIVDANGLPNEFYTSEDFARFERDHLLAKTWICIGVGHHVPGPGDVRPVKILGLPLLLLRDLNGDIKVFHNVCSHRGAELVSNPGTVKRTVVCPYHSWCYGLDGSLRATPSIGGPGGAGQCGFHSVRARMWAAMTRYRSTESMTCR